MKKLLILISFLTSLFFLLFVGCKDKNAIELKIFIKQPHFKLQYTNYLDKFVKKYKDEKGITITYNLEMPNPQNSDEILRTRFGSDEGFDIYTLHPINDLGRYYKAGHVEDLSNQPWVEKLLPNIKKIVSIDNKVLCLPMESVAWGYLYNKSIFNKVGIKPALTISEMKINCEKLKKAGYTPFLLSYNEVWVPQLFTPLIVGALINTKYNNFINEMNSGKGSFAELKEFFDIIDLVHANGTDRAIDLDPMTGCAEFAQGKTAMWVQGPWFAEQILKSDPSFDLAVAPLPINEDPKAAMINVAVSTGLAVDVKSKHKEIAFEFLNYVLDDKESSEFYQSMKFNPVASIHSFKLYPWVETAMGYIKQNKSYVDPVMPQSLKDESGRQIQMYYLKKANKQEIIDAFDKSWKDSLKVQ